MRGLITLPDGNTEMIFSDNDIIYIVEKYLGSEISKFVAELVSQKDANILYAEQRINTDLNSYESTMESQRNTLQEAQESFKLIQRLVGEKRVNKDKIYQLAETAINQINQEL